MKQDCLIVTYRYRLLPRKQQHRALENILEAQRQLYNAALQERIEAYRKKGVTRTLFDQLKGLTELRRDDADARAVPVNLQRGTLKRLDDAYKRYFVRATKMRAGLPRFKAKSRFHSFGFLEFSGISLKGSQVRFKGMPGVLRLHMHRPLPPDSEIRSCVFRQDHKGWLLALAMRIPKGKPRPRQRFVGVDLGLTTFAALSDGGFIPSLRAARRAERRLRRLSRALARAQEGSRGREKARSALRKCHVDIVRQRDDYLHKASARLIREYDGIAVEALSVRPLARSMLAKQVQDASWAKFISFLRYKAARAGVELVEVDPHNTTRDCSECGTSVTKSLGERWHECPFCGLSLDRDLNAARNILNRARVGPGLRNVA